MTEKPDPLFELENELYASAILKAREDFYTYVQLMAPMVIPEGFIDGVHIKEICEFLQRVESGEIKRGMVAQPPRSMKPVDGEALVTLASGERTFLKDINPGDFVLTHAGRKAKVLAVHDQGDLDCLELRTEFGRKLVLAPDHPVYTHRGWVDAGKLEFGDLLGIPVVGERVESGTFKKAAFRMAGYFIGDGNTAWSGNKRKDGSFSSCGANITNFDLEVVGSIKKHSIELGFEASEVPSSAGRYEIRGSRDWLRSSGLAGKTAKNKIVPDWVFRGSKTEIAEFLAAYFECDGCVTKKISASDGYKRKGFTVFFTSASEELLRGVQHLLLRFGINARLRHKRTSYTKKNGELATAWYLAFADQDSCAKFFERIPVIGEKRKRLEQHFPRRKTFDAPMLGDSLVDITAAGKRHCYCLSVDIDNSFIANDIAVHNSKLASVLFPSWVLGRHPKWQMMSISYAADKATDFSREVRNLVASPEYHEIFPETQLAEDTKAANRWHTSLGGVYIAGGITSGIAGRGAHIAIVDDPLSEQDALSPTAKAFVRKWYPGGLRSRLQPGGRIVIVNTRWAEDDLSGWLLENAKNDPKSDQWKVLEVPAIIDEHGPDERSYWPEYKPLDELKALRDDPTTTPHIWNALYQQNPIPEEGNLIKKEYFQIFSRDRAFPLRNYIIMTADTAFSKKETADFSVLQIWSVFFSKFTDSRGVEFDVPNVLCLANRKGRWDYPELLNQARGLVKKYNPDAIVVEKKASGEVLYPDLHKAGLPVYPYTPGKGDDKISRVHAVMRYFAGKRVWVPEGVKWGDELVAEATAFPYGKHDDQVDAMTLALIFLRDSFQLYNSDDQRDEDDSRPRRRKLYW